MLDIGSQHIPNGPCYIKPLTLSAFIPGFVRSHKDSLTRKWSDVLPGHSDSELAQFLTYMIKKREKM